MKRGNDYHGTRGTGGFSAGKSCSFHSTILHLTLTACAHVNHQRLPSLGKYIGDKAAEIIIQMFKDGRITLLFCVTYSYHSVVEDTGIQRSCMEKSTSHFIDIHYREYDA